MKFPKMYLKEIDHLAVGASVPLVPIKTVKTTTLKSCSFLYSSVRLVEKLGNSYVTDSFLYYFRFVKMITKL